MATWRNLSAGNDGLSGQERRRHVRVAGDGLMVMIDGKLHAAADISLGGVRLVHAPDRERGAVIPLRVIPVVEESMLLGQGAHAEARVVGGGRGGLRLAFVRPKPSLARLVAGHARRQQSLSLFS